MALDRRIENTGQQNLALFRYLDTVGDGTGTKNAIGDYSSAAQIFKIAPPANVTYRLARMLVTIEDTTGMTADEYGNIGSALSTGVVIRLQDDSGTLVDITDGLPIKTNAQWATHCFDVDIKSWGQTPSDDLLVARWTFTKAGQFLRLTGDQELQVVLNDDFTDLIAHYFVVQGYVESYVY